MTKPNVSGLLKTAKKFIAKHDSEILTGFGIAGMITTTVLAVRATPEAMRLLEQERDEQGVDKLPVTDVVKTAWKCYIPTAITGVASVTCLISATSINARRTAALAAAYQISETALTEYKEKVIETIGEKKEQSVREKIQKDHIEKNPVKNNEIVVTGIGTTRCYDHLSGRYFVSDIERIKKSVNELNRRMLTDMGGYVSLNEFYDELGLDHIGVGDDLGWNVSSGLIDIDFGSHLCPDGVPCIAIDYRIAPKYDYDSLC